MNINGSSFKAYLIEFKKKIGASNVPNFNLFNYSNEFQNFLKGNGKFDFSLAELSISDILEQSFFDNLQDTTKDMPSSGNKEKDIFASFMQNLFKSDDFKKLLDGDQNNTIDKEEFMKFLTSIDKDGDSDVSIEEMFDGLNDLKDGSLDNIFNMAASPETPSVQDGGNTGGNNSVGDNSGVNNNPDNNTNNNTNNNPENKTDNDNSEQNTGTKPITNMSSEELKAEKTNRENNLSAAQNNLTAVFDGSNDKIQTANNDLKTAKEAYDEAVKNDEKISNDIKSEREENLKNIDTKNNTINTKKSDIAQKENDISVKETVISSDKSTLSALKSSLGSLGSSKDAEKQKEIDAMRTSLETQITELEEKIKLEEEELGNLNAELTTLNDELIIEQKDLEVLEKQREDIEGRISANCSDKTLSALSTYNSAKKNLEGIKASEEESAKVNITKAKELLNEVNNQINVKDAEKIKEDNTVKPSSSSAFAEGNVNYANLGYYNDESGMSYLVMGPDDVKPDEELPMLMFLHGSGEASFGEDKLLNSSLPYTLANGKTMLSKDEFNLPQDFRGYIVFPQLPTSKWWWTNDKAEGCLRSIIGNLCSDNSKFKIDKDRIALAGHSMGGTGAVYMAKKLEDIVKRVAVISGSKAPRNIDASTINIPVKGYYAAREGADYMAGDFRRTFGNENVVEMQFDHNNKRIKHGDTPGVAFAMDSDGNGRSDLFEWLFPDN